MVERACKPNSDHASMTIANSGLTAALSAVPLDGSCEFSDDFAVDSSSVTPLLPSSIHQQLKTDCFIREAIAQDICPDWEKGY